MADFDPDAYLSGGTSAPAGFDPDAYLQGSGSGQQDIGWSDVPLRAASNIPKSAGNLASAVYQTVRHPFDTVYGIADTAVGLGEKAADALGISPNPTGPETTSEQRVDQLKNYYVNRYGSMAGFKHALADDPVGVMADASAVFGGAGAAADAAGATRAAQIASKASQLTNPVNLVNKALFTGGTIPIVNKQVPGLVPGAANLTGKAVTGLIGDVGTRVGETPIVQAYEAGKAGGSSAQNFLDSINNKLPPEQSVDLARDAVQEMKTQKNQAYQQGMAGIAAKTEAQQWQNKSAQMQYNARAEDSGYANQSEPVSMMNFDGVDKRLTELNGMGNYQGLDTDPATATVRDQVSNEVSNFKNMDPAAFHTPMGFDALKQRLYSLADGYAPGSRARLYIDQAAKAVKGAIVDQSPEYAKVMDDYWTASDDIRQIEKELSLGPKGNVGTALRKLQSTMRNNVSTNYGYRSNLADKLTQYGAQNLPAQLAGQAMNTWMPRGYGSAGAVMADLALSTFGGHPMAAAALPFMSPKLMGLSAYGLGAGSRLARAPFAAASRNPVINRLAGYMPNGPSALNVLSIPNRAGAQ